MIDNYRVESMAGATRSALLSTVPGLMHNPGSLSHLLINECFIRNYIMQMKLLSNVSRDPNSTGLRCSLQVYCFAIKNIAKR